MAAIAVEILFKRYILSTTQRAKTIIRPPLPLRHYSNLTSVLASSRLDRGRTIERNVSVLLDLRYY